MAFRATVSRFQRIIRMSERHVAPHREMQITEVMSGIRDDVKNVPGLLNIETLKNRDDPYRYVVLTEWEDRRSLNKWLDSPLHKETVTKLEGLLDAPPNYREFVPHEDDVFLL